MERSSRSSSCHSRRRTGRYTIDLTAEGYTVTLLDLSPALLDFARARIADAGPRVAANVHTVVAGSIVDMSAFADGEYDAVLFLGGVISHLTDRGARQRALGELRRVAMASAPLFISAMNRLSGYRGAVQWLDQFDRIFPPDDGCSELPNGARVYELLPEEFAAELTEAGLTTETMYGSTGIAAHIPESSLEALRRSPERWHRWHEAFVATCDHPSIVGLSPHLLAVCRARCTVVA